MIGQVKTLVAGGTLMALLLGAPSYGQDTTTQESEEVEAGSATQSDGFDPESIPIAIRTGLEYLIANQNEDGSWGGVRNATFTSGFANPATYDAWQIGASGLATRALLELDDTSKYNAELERALDFLIANSNPVRPAEWDVDNNWALIYGLDAVSKALQHPRYAEGERREELVGAGQEMLAGLKKYQSPRGGWGYYSDPGSGWQPDWATSFTTAVAVLAMIEARAAGLELDEKVYNAGVKALQYARLPNGAYEYEVKAVPSHMRSESINQVKGSLGRIQVCNLALFRAGKDVTVEQLVWGLEQFAKHHKFLEVARNKPIPHEAYYANAAYFYLFAHYYAAQVLQVLPEEERAKLAPHVQSGILAARQKDGAMWDFWIAASTKPYGTAFGVMGLEYSLPDDD
ncbi:MAG: hypothetical protein ACI82F_000140 [Planctomycetota bacterium]|jgi:hypothetical protein